jgi:hypothetical protein
MRGLVNNEMSAREEKALAESKLSSLLTAAMIPYTAKVANGAKT